MNETSKMIVVCVVGYLIGMGTGYLIGKKRYERETTETIISNESEIHIDENEEGVTAEERAEIDDYQREAFEKTLERRGIPLTNYNNPPFAEMMRISHELNDEDLKEPEEDEFVNDEEDFEDDEYLAALAREAEAATDRRYANGHSEHPYIISYDEFVDGIPDYEKMTLLFYAKDGIMCEEDDTIVNDYHLLVGREFLIKLQTQTNVWVRNDSLMVLYEIHRIPQAYMTTVAGIIETPNERNERLIKRNGRFAERDPR